ncbi:MAG: serine/threonine protein kinase [Nostoc sp.]|uniref:HPr kinase/phosphorylase n=1 Tax=Nostoc sp. TaxID=1180 RepID=UPI002FFBD44E
MSIKNDNYCYQFYGLNLSINRLLPGLAGVNSSTSIDVAIDLVGEQQSQLPLLEQTFWNVPLEWYQKTGFLLWTTHQDDGTYWRIRSFDGVDCLEFILNPDGSQVWGFWSRDALFTDVVSLLLGCVLGHLLRLRGVTCLHASVVAVDDSAIAILGQSGAGKSTTAAALASRGFSVLADDIAALIPDEKRFWVQPGYPRLRLWPNSVKAIHGSIEDLSLVSVNLDKRFLDLQGKHKEQWQFQPQALPLMAVYILGERDRNLTAPKINSLSLPEAMKHLMFNSYGRAFLTSQQCRQEFEELGQLAKTVPVRELLRPDNLGNLGQIYDVIVEDLHLIHTLV